MVKYYHTTRPIRFSRSIFKFLNGKQIFLKMFGNSNQQLVNRFKL